MQDAFAHAMEEPDGDHVHRAYALFVREYKWANV